MGAIGFDGFELPREASRVFTYESIKKLFSQFRKESGIDEH